MAMGFNLQAATAEVPLSPLQVTVQGGDKLIVRGFKGSFEYIVQEAMTTVVAEIKNTISEDFQLIFKREGSQIILVTEGPVSKSAWGQVLAQSTWPEQQIKLRGPSLPIELSWREGSIQIQNLLSSVQVTADKADIKILGGEGLTHLTAQEGAILVQQRKGEVKIDSYMAKVRAQDIDGRLDLENFAGETFVERVSGAVALTSFKGTTRVTGVSGQMEFKNGQSPLHIEKFKGELRGRSAQGAVYADILGDANVRLETQEGLVSLRLPDSGAWVNLGTSDGALAVPAFLKTTRLQTQQLRTGRLKGANKGTVFVRTASGDIRLR
jgi:hypothetical protein